VAGAPLPAVTQVRHLAPMLGPPQRRRVHMALTVHQRRLLRTPSQWAVAVCALLGFVLFAFVDLTPQVEADFFFSSEDRSYKVHEQSSETSDRRLRYSLRRDRDSCSRLATFNEFDA
jgi:hypothetical protein